MSWKYLTRTVKTALLAVFFFQLVSTVERQVFDFLGYMWAPIIGNFFQIIAVILGLFGACQHYRSFIVVYAVWNLLWLGWNLFVICLYLEVGILNRNRERYILTLGTDSRSWWLEHGIGCSITNSSWLGGASTATDTGRRVPPEEYVEGCILQYYYVEVIHAAVQVLLGMVGLGVAVVVIQASLEQEETFVLANDELEFIMIRSRSASSAATTNIDNFHNLAFDRDDSDDGDSGVLHKAFHPLPLPSPRPHERPPSYGPRPHERPPSYGPRPHERPPSYGPRPHERPPSYGPRPHERPPSYGPRPHERPPSYGPRPHERPPSYGPRPHERPPSYGPRPHERPPSYGPRPHERPPSYGPRPHERPPSYGPRPHERPPSYGPRPHERPPSYGPRPHERPPSYGPRPHERPPSYGPRPHERPPSYGLRPHERPPSYGPRPHERPPSYGPRPHERPPSYGPRPHERPPSYGPRPHERPPSYGPRPHERPPSYGPRPHERPPSYGPHPHERPPSYETSTRNSTTDAETLAADRCHSSGRWSTPSEPGAPPKRPANQWQRGGDQASSRSRRSGRDGNKMRHDPRKELPWVQAAPSVSVEFV